MCPPTVDNIKTAKTHMLPSGQLDNARTFSINNELQTPHKSLKLEQLVD